MAFDASEYLGTVLPALIASRDAPGPLPSATLQFIVAGDDGCAFSYRLDPGAALDVRTGVSDQQDLTLVFQPDDLARFADQTLDVSAAVASQRLKVHGDTALLTWLADHLSA